jgi:hypothetical protein
MNSLFSASSGRVFCVYIFLMCVWFGEKEQNVEHAGQKEFNLQLWSVRVSISVKISANKVDKLEEWLLAPPVCSLRRTHAYDELPFAEPSRAEHTRDGYSL